MKRLVAILMFFLLTICAAYAETEKYTRYTEYTPQKAEPVGLIPGDNHSVLVAWFSRVGNTVFDPDVDVVTTASLQTGDDGEMLGNAQMIAGWIAEATGADVFPIQTAYTYPSDYDQTVEVGEGQDIDQLEPELAAHLERYGKPVTACGSIREGVSEAQDQAGDDAMVCAVGSLYMAGEIRYCMGMY